MTLLGDSASGGCWAAGELDRGFEVLGDPVRNPDIVESKPRDEVPPGDWRRFVMIVVNPELGLEQRGERSEWGREVQ